MFRVWSLFVCMSSIVHADGLELLAVFCMTSCSLALLYSACEAVDTACNVCIGSQLDNPACKVARRCWLSPAVDHSSAAAEV